MTVVTTRHFFQKKRENTMAPQINSTAPQSAPTPLKGLLILIAVLIVIATFVALTFALGLSNGWAGTLFLLYWGGIDQARMIRLLPDAIGALVGVAMGYLLWLLPAQLGGAGVAIFLGVIALSTYFLIMGWLPVVINLTTMLFLSVGAIPQIQGGFDVVDLLLSLATGIAFFGALAWFGSVLARRKSASPA